MQHPPGPRGREVLGFFGKGSLNGTLTFLEQTARKYGPISSFRILTKRIFLVDDADLIKDILVTRQHEFLRDSGATLLRELVGDGLLTRDEPLHRERRRVLQPAFHKDQIASYASAMTGESEEVGNGWASKSEIDVRMEMRRLTLSIVGATLFGTEFRGSADRVATVLGRVAKRAAWLGPAFTFIEPAVLAYRRYFPHASSLFFRAERAELEQIIAPIVHQRRGRESRDVLSLILNGRSETDAPLSDEDIKNEVVTFILAGHETTATALAWTWYLLSANPACTERMCAELDLVLAGRLPTLADVPLLPYTANVFKEAIRLYPPALLFARRPKSTIQLGGFEIEPGQSIFLSPYITQRNPRYFVRPESFEPERWDEPEPPKFSYFPFGGGAKMCIGDSFAQLEGLLVLATLARRWKLTRDAQSPIHIGRGMLLAPDGPMLMRPVSRIGVVRPVMV